MKKKFMWALVLVVGFLAVSCGGNIKKVQNGVFGNYDKTITVGKALENNSTLKGGKWDTVTLNGRDYVRYTVRMTGEQIREYLDYKDKPHYEMAKSFYSNLNKWQSQIENYADMTSMSAEEFKQARDIFKAELDAPNSDDFLRVPDTVTTDFVKINDDFLDPYLLTIKGKIIRGETIMDSNSINKYIRDIVIGGNISRGFFSSKPELGIENGMFTSDYWIKNEFARFIEGTNYADNTDLRNALIRTRTKLYDLCVKANAEYKNARAEYEERRKTDIDPMLTINRHEIVLSFIMNQDDSFTTNMMEIHTEVTLNCFDNLKVRFNVYNLTDTELILSNIYSGYRPKFF